MLPRRSMHFKLIVIISVCMLLFCTLKSISVKTAKNNNELINEEEITRLMEKAKYMETNVIETGKTYYIASNGTSSDGTDINNPMSLKAASKKTYYGNDRVLFKRGDTFYGVSNFNVMASKENMFYLGNYGDENSELPIISGANILTNKEAWKYENGLYKIDLSNNDIFSDGIKEKAGNSYNIAFIKDENEKIYSDRKNTIEEITTDYQFACVNNYLYIKTKQNPSLELGKIKIVPATTLLYLSSNTVVNGLIIEDAGIHGIVRRTYPISNVCIMNCILRSIGGAMEGNSKDTRYGNAIEFWNQAKDTVVTNCIFKDIYDAAYTLQGSNVTYGFENNVCKENIFINCSYPTEFFMYKDSAVKQCNFRNNSVDKNIIINQGHGFGYNHRSSQYIPANSVIWSVDTDDEGGITYRNNRSYNSRKLYFKMYTWSDEEYKKVVRSDNNTYYLNQDTIAFAEDSNHKDPSYLATYNLDQHSKFNYLTDSDIEEISNTKILNSTSYDEIKAYYDNFDIKYRNRNAVETILEKTNEVASKETYKRVFQNNNIRTKKAELLTSISSLGEDVENINKDKVITVYNKQYELLNTIIEEYYNNNITITKEQFIALIDEIDKISTEYKEIFSYYITSDEITINLVRDILNSVIDKYNSNTNVDLSNATNIINTAKKIYTYYIQTDNICENILNKQRILNLSNLAEKIVNLEIDIFMEKENVKVIFDKDTNIITNENITATVIHGTNAKILNNNGMNSYTFTENGSFDFILDIKGKTYKLEVTVTNINKEYKIENGYIKGIVKNTIGKTLSSNLSIRENYSILHNGKEINLQNDKVSTGDVLKTKKRNYTLLISGDIDSDGDSTIWDLVKYRKYILEYITLTDIQKMAIDLDDDGQAGLSDLVLLRKEILK